MHLHFGGRGVQAKVPTAVRWSTNALLVVFSIQELAMTELEPWAELCERLAGTTKKLEKRAWMADYLRELPAEAAALAALYISGTPFAEADGRQLNVGA